MFRAERVESWDDVVRHLSHQLILAAPVYVDRVARSPVITFDRLLRPASPPAWDVDVERPVAPVRL